MTLPKRILSSLAFVGLLAYLSLPAHEFVHLTVLKGLGGDGYITYNWYGGYVIFTQPPSSEALVDLSGGIGTALVLSVFWFLTWWSKTIHDTNLEAAAFAVGMGHLVYAPTELVLAQEYGAMAFGVGFAAAAVLYLGKIGDWMAWRDDTEKVER